MGIAIVIFKFHVESWVTYICYKRPMGINSHPRILIVWQLDIITHKRKDIYIGPVGKSDWFKVLCSITFLKEVVSMEVDDDPLDSVQCTWYFNQSLLYSN